MTDFGKKTTDSDIFFCLKMWYNSAKKIGCRKEAFVKNIKPHELFYAEPGSSVPAALRMGEDGTVPGSQK